MSKSFAFQKSGLPEAGFTPFFEHRNTYNHGLPRVRLWVEAGSEKSVPETDLSRRRREKYVSDPGFNPGFRMSSNM
jgi:hypothetical protein